MMAANDRPPAARLGKRQYEALRLIAQGQSRKGAARRMRIAEETVDELLRGCYERLDARNAPHAVYRCFVEGAGVVVPDCTEQHAAVYPPRYVQGVYGGGEWACLECERIRQARDLPVRRGQPRLEVAS